MDSKGQVSLEYLLIFSISLIILIVFTLPLLEQSMDNTFDVSDSIKTKADLSKIAQAINEVYGDGQGSKQTVYLDIDKPVKIDITKNHVSSKIKLKNNQQKEIRIEVISKLEKTSFKLSEGKKTFVIEWPENSQNMIIHQE
ncbi:class III signal peptide-containing protein [Methanobrevibacter sp.]|uniref:class III signal peptide-containing protein n=1 Tax=Methanobrevibacter sp. TaxID=66852 RepID=UPI00386BC04B